MTILRAALLISCVLGLTGLAATAAHAQSPEVKEKPPLYTYYSTWALPRAKWAEMEKTRGAANGRLEKALQSGTLVAYGDDEVVVHTVDGDTHDGWFSSMSIAGDLNTLSDVMQGGSTTSGVYTSATKHSDLLLESRYYAWKSGTYKGAYTHTSVFKLKDSAPPNAIDVLAKGFLVPFLEKMLAEGLIVEYEIDEQVIHTDSPALFYVDFISPTAEGQEKVLKALDETDRTMPLVAAAFDAMIDYSVHRDVLVRGDATYK